MKGTITSAEQPRIRYYLDLAAGLQASDIHFSAGQPPVCRVHGELMPLSLPPMDPGYLRAIILEITTDKQRAQFEETRELDFSYFHMKGYYFRVNVHQERGNIAATVRIMPMTLRSLPGLGLPAVLGDLALKRSGLLLVVGRVGTGKTTTLTHLVEHINQNRASKIVTIEDPIEFIHTSRKSLIVQREVGADTQSFVSGLKYALRQDPDVVVVGEMRDLESISMVLTTAETGHLVLATLHASDAVEAVNRIVDVYPGDKQNQIRLQLAENLLAVVGQQLLPRKDSSDRVLAVELLVNTMPVRNLIRRHSLAEIRSQMESGREGTCTIEQSLTALLRQGLITPDTARSHAKFPALLEM